MVSRQRSRLHSAIAVPKPHPDPERRHRSLRRRLQSTTFLAVLAGYGVLLLLNQGLNSLQRRANHAQLVAAVQGAIAAGTLRLPTAGVLTLPSGAELRQVPTSVQQSIRLERRRQLAWLVSANGGLQVRQNVTGMLDSQFRNDLLLLAVAGFSSLVTSTLLERVLHDGLVQPLEELSLALAAAEPNPSEPGSVDPAIQPDELHPIAVAYNDLQQRLVAAWQQQRILVDGMAHELRMPLTVISCYAQRLERLLNAGTSSSVAPDAEPLLQTCRDLLAEAGRMTGLLRDLLDLARGETGHLELQLKPLDAAEILLESFERLERLAEPGRMRLLAPDPEQDLQVLGVCCS